MSGTRIYEFARLSDGLWSIRRDGTEIGLAPGTLSRRDARVIEAALNGKSMVPGMWPEADESGRWLDPWGSHGITIGPEGVDE